MGCANILAVIPAEAGIQDKTLCSEENIFLNASPGIANGTFE
jgi:hypothetical protein